MRITLRIDDGLLTEAKQLALDRGRTLTEIVEDALRVFLAQHRSSRVSQQRLQLHIVHGQGLQPRVDLSNNAALADLMDQRRSRI